MRFLVAPVLVASTIGIFGTGVAMFFVGRRGMVVGLHKASFVVWFGAMGIHVLVYAPRLLRLLRSEWLRRERLGGRLLRGGAVAAAIGAGAVLAIATLPSARPWLHHFRGGDGREGFARDRAADRPPRRPRALRLPSGFPPEPPRRVPP